MTGGSISDRAYLERRAAQATLLASVAPSERAAIAHEMMAAAYLRKLGRLAELEEKRELFNP